MGDGRYLRRIQCGSSYHVLIPVEIIEALDMYIGQDVLVGIDDGRIIIEAV